jgi:hydrogenase maturation protease
MNPSLLIAGVGNIFLGDDGFGVEVVRRLTERRMPHGVQVRDFGIRGLDLAYALADGYDGVILVDTVARGGRPGTLYAIEPQLSPATPDSLELPFEAHSLDPAKVLQLAQRMAGRLPWVRLVGCEPAALDESMQLSGAVAAAVDQAIALVEDLVAEFKDRHVQPAETS